MLQFFYSIFNICHCFNSQVSFHIRQVTVIHVSTWMMAKTNTHKHKDPGCNKPELFVKLATSTTDSTSTESENEQQAKRHGGSPLD